MGAFNEFLKLLCKFLSLPSAIVVVDLSSCLYRDNFVESAKVTNDSIKMPGARFILEKQKSYQIQIQYLTPMQHQISVFDV